MDLGSIFLILAMLVLVALFIAKPLLEHKATVISESEQEYSALLAEQERILNALQELEFDHILRKIPEEDYPLQRKMFVVQGAEILKQLDAFKENLSEQFDTNLKDQFGKSDILDENDSVESKILLSDDELDALIAERKREKQNKSAGFCPQCGAPVEESDVFCSLCGARLITKP